MVKVKVRKLKKKKQKLPLDKIIKLIIEAVIAIAALITALKS